jgi:MFS family permease
MTESSDPRRWRMLPVILTVNFMSLFDFFVVNVAAPSLKTHLHAGQADLELIIGGYAFAYASCLITGGRLGDQFSYRRIFLLGVTAFTVASALCGLAQNPGELVAARLLQGLTAAAMVPQVIALITAVFPPQERARALSWFGVSIGVGSVAGQVLGGLLLDANVFGLGWRAIFLVNVPIGVVAITLGARLVPPIRSERHPQLDLVGAVGLAGALGLILVPLTLGRVQGWPVWTWVCMAASVPALAAVLGWEYQLGRGRGQPLLDLSLFRSRSFCAGLGINMAVMAYFASFMFGLTLMLQDGLRLSPLQAGLTFALHGVIFAVVSLAARRVASAIGPPATVTLGMAVVAAGLGAMITVVAVSGAASSPLRLIGPIAVIGIGNGLAVPTFIGAVIMGVPPNRAGSVAGILATAQQFGLAAGIAVLGGAFFAALGPRTSRTAFASAFTLLNGLELGLVVVSIALSALLYKSRSAPSAMPVMAGAKPVDQASAS